jgi:NADH-quinone oxidoreductase subunit A
MIREYAYLLVSISIGLIVSFVVFNLSNFLIIKQYDLEKTSSYECGFDPFEDSRTKFDVKFYLVAILFIIFDLEIVFLFPWAVSLGNIDFLGFWSMVIFLFILTVGFLYEWFKGALDWE